MPSPNDDIIGSAAEIQTQVDTAGGAFGFEAGAPGARGNPPGAKLGAPGEEAAPDEWAPPAADIGGPAATPTPAVDYSDPLLGLEYGAPGSAGTPPGARLGAAGEEGSPEDWSPPPADVGVRPARIIGLQDTAQRPDASNIPPEYADLFRAYTPPDDAAREASDRVAMGSVADWEQRAYAPGLSPAAQADALNAQLEDERYQAGRYSEYRSAVARGYTGGMRRFFVEGELNRRNDEAQDNGEDFDEAAERDRVESAFDNYRPGRSAQAFSKFAEEADMPPPTYWQSVRLGLGAWQGMNLGFAAMQTGEGMVRAFTPSLEGESALPDQEGAGALTSLIPLITTGAGALIGARFGAGPQGAIVGNMLGSPLENLADEWMQGHFFEQERGGLNLGYGRGSVEELTSALEKMGGSVKDVTELLDDLSKVAPVLPGSAAYFGGLSQSEGVNFTGAQEATTDFLTSSPFLYPSLARFSAGIDPSTGRPTDDVLQSSDYQHLTFAAAATGRYADVQGLEKNYAATLGDMETSRRYQLDHPLGGGSAGAGISNFFENYSKLPLPTKWSNPLFGIASDIVSEGASSYRSAINDEYDVAEAPLKAREKATAAEADRLQAAYEGTQSAIDRSQSIYGVLEQGAQNRYLAGGGAGVLMSALPGEAKGIAQGRARIDSQINSLRVLARQDPANADYYQQNIRELEYAAEGQEGDYLGGRLRAETAEISQTGALYTSEEAGLGYRAAVGTYHGETAQQLQPLVNRMAASEQSYAASLDRYASDMNLPPEVRYELREQGYGLEQSALEQRYSNRIENYNQRLGRADIGISQAQVGVRTAEAYGGASDISNAFGQEADAYRSKIAELTQELSKGGLQQDDWIQKTQALTQAEGDLALIRSESFEATASRISSMAGSAVTIAGATAETTVSTVGGVAGIGATSGLASSQLSQATIYDKLAAAAPNEQQRDYYQGLAAQSRAEATQTDLSMGTVPVSPALQEKTDTATAELARMQMGYATPGNMNDARMGVYNDLGAIIGQTRSEWQSALEKATPDEKDELNREFNARVQDLETERTRLLYDSDQNFYSRLPALSQGGPSFAGRYLPTDAQAAAMEDSMGYGRYGMRVHGYDNTQDFNDFIIQPGSTMTTVGGSPASTYPGNLSLAAMSGMVGHDALATGGRLPMIPPSTAPPLPGAAPDTSHGAGPGGDQALAQAIMNLVARLGGGLTINIPGLGRGVLQAAPAATQKNMSDVAGMGAGHATGIFGTPTGTGT